ncbi:hypothetical protein SAMD00024442_28_47 [Candidatus Symbiothrix dinenymphae]|nr:hypothetical protein SAMD00024442_28_47 [Candidatus Symbiothrix dinenymphae]
MKGKRVLLAQMRHLCLLGMLCLGISCENRQDLANFPRLTISLDTGTTYALVEQDENRVDTVWILLFNESDQVAVQPEMRAQNAGIYGSEVIIDLRAPQYNAVVVLANVRLADPESLIGKTKEDIMRDLVDSRPLPFPNVRDKTTIPMWGEKKDIAGVNARVTIYMTRMVAKVNLEVAPTAMRFFDLEHILVINAPAMGLVVPKAENWLQDATSGKGKALKPSIPQGYYTLDLEYRYTNAGGSRSEGDIYLFEAENLNKSADARTYLELEGTYYKDGREDPNEVGEPGYTFRVDFSRITGGREVPLDILRNTLYELTMTATGREKKKDFNFTLEVIDWNDVAIRFSDLPTDPGEEIDPVYNIWYVSPTTGEDRPGYGVDPTTPCKTLAYTLHGEGNARSVSALYAVERVTEATISIAGELNATALNEAFVIDDSQYPYPAILLRGPLDTDQWPTAVNFGRLNAGNAGRVLRVASRNPVTLGDNLILTGGDVSDVTFPDVRGGGGGVLVCSGSTVIMAGGEISGNKAVMGGGVYVESGAEFRMEGGTIRNDSAAFGGGVAIGTFMSNNAVFTFSGGNIRENKAALAGGGVYAGAGEGVYFNKKTAGGAVISNNKVMYSDSKRGKAVALGQSSPYSPNPVLGYIDVNLNATASAKFSITGNVWQLESTMWVPLW